MIKILAAVAALMVVAALFVLAAYGVEWFEWLAIAHPIPAWLMPYAPFANIVIIGSVLVVVWRRRRAKRNRMTD